MWLDHRRIVAQGSGGPNAVQAFLNQPCAAQIVCREE
jgi:hypothetical protein